MPKETVLDAVRRKYPGTTAEQTLLNLYDNHRAYGAGGIYKVAEILGKSPSAISRAIEKARMQKEGKLNGNQAG